MPTRFIIRDYYGQLYAKRLDNIKEMDALEVYNLPRLNHEEIENQIGEL